MPEGSAEDLSKTVWRDDQWLGFFPLNIFTVLDYFALSPFYDRTCNNELAKAQAAKGVKVNLATLPPGIEYELQDAQEPHLFVIRKQHRSGPKTTASLQFYYILDGSVYQAPSLHAAISSRIDRCLFNVQTAFNLMHKDLDPLLKETAAPPRSKEESTAALPATQEGVSKGQMQTVDRVIMSVLQKYPMEMGHWEPTNAEQPPEESGGLSSGSHALKAEKQAGEGSMNVSGPP